MRHLIGLILFTTFFSVLPAQETIIKIRGIVDCDFEPLSEASIIIYKNQIQDNTIKSGENGTFTVDLMPQENYTLKVTKEGYITKLIAFDTHMPEELTGEWLIEFAMSLFKPCDGVDLSILDKPVSMVKFNPAEKAYSMDEAYAGRVLDRIQNLSYKNEDCWIETYDKNIANADNKYKSGDYIAARELYEAALAIFPGEKYPNKQLEKIKEKLKDQEANDKLYAEAIKNADQSFNSNAFVPALSLYKKALVFKPGDGYAQAQIKLAQAEIQNREQEQAEILLAQQQNAQEQEQQLNDLISKGENYLNLNNPAEALSAFKQAIQLKPGDGYILSQLNKAEKLLQEKNEALAFVKQKEQEQERLYNAALAKGDNFFTLKEYEQAILAYKEAVAINPDNPVAKQKQTETETIIQQQKETAARDAMAANKEQEERARQERLIEQQFNTLLTQGENALKQNDAVTALAAFKEANALKPNDGFVAAQISRAEKIIALEQQLLAQNEAKEKEREQKYATAIAKGDNFFKLEEYERALLAYQEAIILKPDAVDAQQKKSETNRIIQERSALAAQKQKQSDAYNNAISQADQLFGKSEYTAAKEIYLRAQGIDNQQPYPGQQILKIDRILATQSVEAAKKAEEQNQFDALLTNGENFLSAEKPEEAIQAFKKALEINKNDGYTAALLARAEKMHQEQIQQRALAQKQASLEQAYDEAIKNGDNMLKLKEYNSAISFYDQALAAKTGDAYAMQQKSKAQGLILDAQKNAEYEGIIRSADAMFKSKNYEGATKLYHDAIQVKQNDVYAGNKIDEIKQLVDNERKAALQKQETENMYKALIAKADDAVSAKKWEQASDLYREAMALKPEESYPKQQLSMIQDQLAAINSNERYNAKLAEADASLASRNYQTARVLYTEASGIKPAEDLPKTKIREIDALLARIKKEEALEKANAAKAARDLQQYNNLIAAADKKYDDAYYQDAKKLYQDALTIKSNESYPTSRIRKIDETLALLGRGNQSSGSASSKTSQEAVKNTPSSLKDIKFASDRELKDYLENLKMEYPEGITHEIYRETKTTINRFVIIRGGEVTEIREVKHSWGGVDYTRNGKPITMGFFKQQTEKRDGEYYKKFEK